MFQVQVPVLFAAVWLIATVPIARSQEVRALIGGKVTDPTDAVVPGADVVVTSDDTGVAQRTTTNEQGNWAVQFLLPGQYRFSISARGFRPAEREGITLQTSDRKTIDVKLELGAATQTVGVVEAKPLFNTTTAYSSTVINSQEVSEIPSMNRVPTLLAVLSPGVVQQDQNNNTLHGWSYYGASQFSAGGGRNNIYSNYYTLDGFPNVKSGGYVAFIPAPDLISEFRVQIDAYDASTGRQAGSAINMTTKSGTKEYHGDAYEFNQNNFLNARQFNQNLTNSPMPPVRLNIYGFTLGGPVWIPKVYNGKRKTFFFISWEGLRNKNPNGGVSSVPTAVERGGDFSQSFTTLVQGGQRVVYPYTIYDPLSVDAKGNRTPFTGNLIPDFRISQIALNLLKYVPLPNATGDGTSNTSNNYIEPSVREDKMAFFSGRADHQWNDFHRSFVVLRWDTNHETQGNKFLNVATGTDQVRTPKALGLDHVWTVSPNKVLDVRFSINRYEELTQNTGVGFNPTQLGFSPQVAKTFLYPEFPQIIGVASNFGTDTNTYTMNSYYTWSASLSHTRGNHNLHYGLEYWILQQSNSNYGAQPQIAFDNVVWTRQNNLVSGGTANGNAMSQFLLGLPSGGQVPFNASEIWSQKFTAVYIQDDWRLTPKLTVNLGLRWDYERPVTERYNRMTSNFDPGAVNPISAAAQAAYVQIAASGTNNDALQQLLRIVPTGAFQVLGVQRFAGVGGQSAYAVQPDYSRVQPRAGFAYRLGPNTVLRGGVGRFTIASWETGNQNGFSITTNLNASTDNYITPSATLANPFPGGLATPTGSSLGPLTNLGNGGIGWMNQNPGRPGSWQYSLSLQHQIKSWLFEVGYAHNKTSHLWVGQNRNLPAFSVWQQMNQVQFDGSGRPQDTLLYNAPVPNPFQNLAGVSAAASVYKNSTVTAGQLARRVSILGDITQNDNPIGKNQWDALVAKVEHRIGNGLTLINAFTWSKMIEDMSFLGPQNLGILEHRLADQDRPFHLSIAPVWEIPIGRGRALGRTMPKLLNAIAGGWELAGQYTIQSGSPVYFANNTSTGNFFFSGKEFSLPRDKRSFDRWFDTSQFVPYPLKNTDISNYPAWTGILSLPGADYRPAAGDTIKNGVYQDFANWVRTLPTAWSHVRSDRVNELNLGVYKNFHPVEQVKVQFRFETFNTLNHPRFPAPQSDPYSPQFGTVSKNQVNAARAIQMAMKIYF